MITTPLTQQSETRATSAPSKLSRRIHAYDAKQQLRPQIHQDQVGKIGGTTSWKLGPAAAGLAAQARRRGLWVHLGRVNSLRRLRYAQAIGCHSVDGTFLAFGPDRNLPTLLRWLGELHAPQVHGVSDPRCVTDADRVGHSPSGTSSGSSTT